MQLIEIINIRIKHIIYGWMLYLMSGLKIRNNDIAYLKYEKCKDCSMFNKKWCDIHKCEAVEVDFVNDTKVKMIKGETECGCGCYLPAKVFSESKCPLGKFETI